MKPGLHNHLCFRLYVASRLVIQTYNEEFQEVGLTYLKYLVLLALSERDGMTVNELGEILFLDSGTLSPLLKSLEKQGHITRKRLSSDERQVANFLTPQGEKMAQDSYRIVYRLYKRTGLTENAFFHLLEKTDDFVRRCKNILVNRKNKETQWKTKSEASAYLS